MKLNEQLKSYFTKCGHINASFYEGKACINVSLRFRTFYLSLDTTVMHLSSLGERGLNTFTEQDTHSCILIIWNGNTFLDKNYKVCL